MSIIIKGINKPKNCDYCQFCIEEDVMFETEYRCSITGIYMDEDHCFPDICPIAELPEHHGRLIDADALVAQSLEDGAYGYVDTKQIYEASTIIKAE